MTWTDKLETLITESEFLFIGDKVAIKDILQKKYANELVAYLKLDSLGLGKAQKSWSLVVFLHVLNSYSKGERLSLNQLLAQMSSGLKDMKYIDEAIDVLEIKRVLIKKTSRFRPKPEVSLEVIPVTIDKVMNKLPLPEFNSDEIEARKLLVFLRHNGYEISDFYIKEAQDIIDSYLEKSKLSFIPKLDKYKSVKGESKYLMILLMAKQLGERTPRKDMSSSAITLNIKSDPYIAQLSNENTKLHQLGWLDSDSFDFDGLITIFLSQKAIDKFDLEKKNGSVKERTGGGGSMPSEVNNPEQDFFKIIPNKLIDSETLFYNQPLLKELDFYKNLLNKEDKTYTQNPAIKGRMILMFDGLPGTGKTAAAQQLAKESKRDLVHVNWQTFRGQFVGQSEKNLQELLNDIDKMSCGTNRIPVVLFNEAEAFLSQRIAISQSTDRMENNLVSMLLEWLEKKDPFSIVIFTSNHRELMDKAFERRISHITFDLPDEITRIKIWKSLADKNGISDQHIYDLAQYPLSGAEISQVLRTYHLHQIAYELELLDMDLLHQLCRGQKWMEQRCSIGFKKVEL